MERNLRIIVGSTNKAKVDAVMEILQEYPHLAHAEVSGIPTLSGVSDQPKTLLETITGARNRAESVFANAEYSVGIESGLMEVPHSKSGFMDICVCAIFDGKAFHLGISSAWEFPDPRVTALMIEEGLDMSQAIRKAGLTTNPNIGMEEGAIGILTKGKLDRKAYTKQALRTALIHLEQLEF
jgi:inosine/xanthosine triphosphatase